MTEPSESPVELARALIRCESVTPRDAGAIEVLVQALKPARFTCEKLTFSEGGTQRIENLDARVGDSPPHLCFAGHTDVVPVGDASSGANPPFAANLLGGVLRLGRRRHEGGDRLLRRRRARLH